jgi:uncharacterized membrane protein YqhA
MPLPGLTPEPDPGQVRHAPGPNGSFLSSESPGAGRLHPSGAPGRIVVILIPTTYTHNSKERTMQKPDIPDTTGTTMQHGEQGVAERVFEGMLWNSRFIVLLGVIFGALSAIVLFIAGSLEIFNVLVEYIAASGGHLTHEDILIAIIGAVDFYLIGLVLLIFSFGMYELFISELDIARRGDEFGSILEVSNLDDLKNKIIKVIIMVLIVSFFQRILSMEFATSIDMLAMAVSIGVICVGVYFLGKHNI